MYRDPAPRPKGELPPPQLVYAALDRAGDQRVMLLFQLVPAVGLVVAAVVATSTWGLVGFLASAGAIVFWWRRARRPQEIVLRVERNDLHVKIGGVTRLIRLDDLTDVALDVKTIQRVVDGNSAIPALRFADSRVAPEVDTARIVLVDRKGQTPLTEAYVAHMDATEWLGKIRVFLRKHGWLPDDERDADA